MNFIFGWIGHVDILLGYIGVRLMTLVAVLYDYSNSEYLDNVGNFNKYYTTQSYAMVLLEDNKYIIDCLTDNKPGKYTNAVL